MRYKLRSFTGTFLAAAQGFLKDDCFLKASSLTYYTLLSIVPFLAVALGIAKGFGFEKYLEAAITARLQQNEIAQPLINFAYTALEQAHGGVIAFAGVIILFVTSIQLLGNIERLLNEIWEVKTQRSYVRQLTDYLAIVILCPVFFILANSITIFISTQVLKVSHASPFLEVISPYILFLIRLSPFVLNWMLFTIIYVYMPNTTVKWRYALIAGIIAGTIYQILQAIYIYFQIGVSSYGAIYGSLAALPLFLVWLNLSWIVVLGGAEIAYHLEVSPDFSEEITHQATKKNIGLGVVVYCAQLFIKDKPPVSVHKLTEELGAPLRVMRYILSQLLDAGILARDQQGALVLAKNPEKISVMDIFDVLEEKDIRYPVKASHQFENYELISKEFEESSQKAPVNLTLRELTVKLYGNNGSQK